MTVLDRNRDLGINESLELTSIGDALKNASEYGLEPEVIWSALKAMRENPKLSIQEAMTAGILEWDL